MNRNFKRIVAMVVAIGAVSAVAPATNINLLTTKAYASNSEDYLDRLNLYNEDGDVIKLYSDTDYNERVADDKVEDGEVYYAKTSSDTVNLDIDGPSDNYIRIFRGSEDSSKGKEVDDDIKLSSDSVTTTFFIKVYGEEPSDNIRYKDNDDYNVLSTYKIKVKYTGDDDADTEEDSSDYDKIYLERLSVDGKMINLSNSEIKYTSNVDSNVDEVTIRATPEDDDSYVDINGDDVNEDDSYKLDVDLVKGENEFKIELENDGDTRVYTLVINRGNVSSTSTSTTTEETNEAPKSQWVKTNGVWQYNDAAGKVVKNSWVQNYFVQADGNMATEWLNNDGSWYYLGADGAKKTGWKSVGGKWYCLDSQGKMIIGWMKDMNGKYYYLNGDGSMAYNITIGGYKLGANGAWTGK